jgi:hypothetical protein
MFLQRMGTRMKARETSLARLPERSAPATAPVVFIWATNAARPAFASAAAWEIGAARPGGGVGSFLREARRLSSASARESNTSGCINVASWLILLHVLEALRLCVFAQQQQQPQAATRSNQRAAAAAGGEEFETEKCL